MIDEILKQYTSMLKEVNKLREKHASLPKGSLRRRQIRGRAYHYLQYREGRHVRSKYVKKSEVAALQKQLSEKEKCQKHIAELEKRLFAYERSLGIRQKYRPIKNIDYPSYTLFMSSLAHDYRRLGLEGFLSKYDVTKYRGLNKRYLRGYIDYISGINNRNARRTNDLVLDPYTYLMYFKYGDKGVIEQELKKAIPAFLNQGLLITSVQEAVHGAHDGG